MSGRLDELFSPERLRENWQEPAAPAPAAPPAPPNVPQLLLAELEQLLAERFQHEALPTLIGELRERIDRCFPTEGDPPSGDARVALRQEIEERCALLEDLADALSLPRRRP